MKPASILRSVALHEGRVFKLLRETVTLPNGLTTHMEVIRHPGASAVVPVLEGRRLVLIRQYRHALRDYIWEIPAGTLNPGEAPVECAARELREETGFAAGNLGKLGEILPAPGYADERIHLFVGTHLRKVPRSPEQDEVLSVRVLPVEKALEMIRGGEIQDSKSIIGILRARELL